MHTFCRNGINQPDDDNNNNKMYMTLFCVRKDALWPKERAKTTIKTTMSVYFDGIVMDL